MIKISPAILLSIFLCLPAFAQIHDGNILLEMALDRQSYRFDNLYSRTTEDSLVLPDALKRGWGVDIAGGYQNGAPDPYTFTANKGKYWVSPFYYGQLHPLIKVKYRLRATNKREDYIDPNRTYWSDEFSGIRGDIELGALTFDHPNFRVKFGRDYLLPAVTLSENLLHSLYTYPYDQLQLGYRNRYLELSSYYLQLNATRDSTAINRRHLNGHRLRVRLGERGFAAVNEIVIYGGGERSANWMFLNPFLGYYVYQKNARNFTSNTIITGEIFLKEGDWFTYLELLIDDFQVDNKEPKDLEPTEYGLNWSAGRKNLVPGLHALFNYTRVANRTFNAPFLNHEKFIYQNLPIGHYLGNNFWEMRAQLTYEGNPDWWIQAGYYHRRFGEEALYGEFNTDFLNATVAEGYSEAFPFGETRTQNGFQLKSYFTPVPQLTAQLRLAYWLEAADLPESFVLGVALGYRL